MDRGSILAVSAAFVLLSGCGPTASVPSPASLDALSKLSGIAFPASAKVVFEETEARAAAEGYGMWIVSAQEETKLPGNPLAIPASSVRNVIETHLRGIDLGVTTGEQALAHRWTSSNSDWRASVLRTSNGWHIVVERSKQP